MNLENEEEKKPLFIECPHCHVDVILLENNICPACREDVSNSVGVNVRQVALVVKESENMPPYCHSCGSYTDQLIRISADEESNFETIFFGEKPPEETSNVIVYLPECELCSESEIELVEVDYDRQTMKIMVHPKFHERVIQNRK